MNKIKLFAAIAAIAIFTLASCEQSKDTEKTTLAKKQAIEKEIQTLEKERYEFIKKTESKGERGILYMPQNDEEIKEMKVQTQKRKRLDSLKALQ